MAFFVEAVQQRAVKAGQRCELVGKGLAKFLLILQPRQRAHEVSDHAVHHLGTDQPVLPLKFQQPRTFHAVAHHGE